MPFDDFRSFLTALRDEGQLIEVDRPVALELEVAKAMRKSAATGGPAIVFNNNGTKFPLVGGIYNSRAKALLAYGCTEENAFGDIVNRLKTRSPPVYVDDGPVHENVILGDDIDLRVAQAYINPLIKLELRSGMLDSDLALDLKGTDPLAFSLTGRAEIDQLHTLDTLKSRDFVKWQRLLVEGLAMRAVRDPDLPPERVRALLADAIGRVMG